MMKANYSDEVAWEIHVRLYGFLGEMGNLEILHDIRKKGDKKVLYEVKHHANNKRN